MATSTNAAPHNGYEKSDASPRGLLYFLLIMAAILVATSLSLIWLFKHFERAENPGSFVAAPFAGSAAVASASAYSGGAWRRYAKLLSVAAESPQHLRLG